ncbi:MAG: MFS transporter [Bacteroidales bacterium]|nr:MFS transporter [Bacteroidales bacterium]
MKKFPKTFWVANTIELFERWAWYGFFMLFANYLTGSSDVGGLEFTQTQKGMIMGIGTGILYFLPVITGSIADKYGYKKVLILAFTIYTSAFILLPMFDSFTGVFIMYLYLALGAALFKPVISATIAKTTTDETASIGFGIFYLMVNLGAFLGPMITLIFKSASYDMVFHISAGIIALNFILLLFYKEPGRKKVEGSFMDTMSEVFTNIVVVLKDLKFVVFLIIISGFWTMYNQLFFTLPVFITQWVDSSAMFYFFQNHWSFISETYGEGNQLGSEFITNFDAMFIIIFQLIVSSVVMKKKPLGTMITGIIISSIGMALTLFTQNVLYTMVAIFIFAIGEMTASPKITEYIGRIAPADKKALYMGYSFIPVFLGNIFAGFISGNVYQNMSDKISLLKEEVALRGINIPEISHTFSQNDYVHMAEQKMGMSSTELTNYLWNNYHPANIWMIIAGIGLLSAVSLMFYNRFLINSEN